MLVKSASENYKVVLNCLDTKQGAEVNKVKENVTIEWNYDNREWESEQFITNLIQINVIIELNITISFYTKDNYGTSNLEINIINYKLNYPEELDETDLENIKDLIENEYCKKLNIIYLFGL